MNIKNNSRYKMSSEKIETAFLSLLNNYKYEEITISQVCKQAGVNRSTFYCHYDDINDLIIKIENKFAQGTVNIFNYGERQNHEAMIEMFSFVKENKLFYNAFLNIPYITIAEKQTKNECLEHISQKINADTKQKNNLFYRASFFGAGIKELCRLWLEKGCVESPKQMAELLLEEYKNRDSMF